MIFFYAVTFTSSLHTALWHNNISSKEFSNFTAQVRSDEGEGRRVWVADEMRNGSKDWAMTQQLSRMISMPYYKSLLSTNKVKESRSASEKCFLQHLRPMEVNWHINLTLPAHTRTCMYRTQLLLPSSPEFYPLLLFLIHLRTLSSTSR